jgi:phage-related protein
LDDLDPPVMRPVIWLGNAKKNLQAFPKGAQKLLGQLMHAFQKKSRKGVATPKHDVELVRRRYKEAQELAQ